MPVKSQNNTDSGFRDIHDKSKVEFIIRVMGYMVVRISKHGRIGQHKGLIEAS